jgi:hypothetical protein
MVADVNCVFACPSVLFLFQPPGSKIFGSLPENRPHTSKRYSHWLKLVRLGYDGGEAERALSIELGDVDRAALRLSRDYSGYHGMHCLSQGNCFGDPRQSVFKAPQSQTVPERPPFFQEPPPITSVEEAAAQRRADEAAKRKAGTDYSAEVLRQKFSEPQLPKLDPFLRVTPLPVEVEHDRNVAPLRHSTLGTTEKQDAFTKLMRSWLTTINSPFHTQKPGSVHESDAEDHELPKDTHQEIVPAHMQRTPGGMLRVEWHQPAAYQSQTLAQIQAAIDAKAARLKSIEESKGHVISIRAAPATMNTPQLTPAQEQEQELAEANGAA